MGEAMEEMIHLDPAKIQADDNTRWGLKQTGVDAMKASIVENGIMEPVEVEPLVGVKGFTHKLTMGFYRHAAALALNAEGAGLLLPAIERQAAEGTDRLKRQIAENVTRESMSPMDKATAIKRLQTDGVPNPDIRRIFASAGGRKGNTVQPMSNAMMNILLNLLLLPKGMQEKVHDGRVGVEAAYILGKVPADKRAAVLERAEADQESRIAQEEKDENRYLDTLKKAEKAKDATTTAASALETAKADVEAAHLIIGTRVDELQTIRNEPGYEDKTEAEKKDWTGRLAGADALLKESRKTLKQAQNRVAKATKTVNDAKDKAAAEAKKAAEAMKPKKAAKDGKTKAIGKKDIAKAAEKEGTKAGYVPLNVSDIRQVVKDLQKEGGPAKVILIGAALSDCFAGKTTPKQLVADLLKALASK